MSTPESIITTIDLGREYLSLDRPFPTLSGGESQRIRLAGQVGRALVAGEQDGDRRQIRGRIMWRGGGHHGTRCWCAPF